MLENLFTVEPPLVDGVEAVVASTSPYSRGLIRFYVTVVAFPDLTWTGVV